MEGFWGENIILKKILGDNTSLEKKNFITVSAQSMDLDIWPYLRDSYLAYDLVWISETLPSEESLVFQNRYHAMG